MEKNAGKELIVPAAVLVILAAERLGTVISPLLTGVSLALFLDPVRGFFERRLRRLKRLRRAFSVFLTLASVTAAVFLLIRYAGEKLAASIAEAMELLPVLGQRADEMSRALSARTSIDISALPGKAMESLFSALSNMIDRLFTGGGSMAVGIVFAVWMLAGRDRILELAEKLCSRSPAPEKRLADLSLCRKSFSAFVRGQTLDAVILGSGCFAGMLLFRKPFAALISLIIGLTALIPAAGAWAGAAFGALLLFSVSVADGVWFLVFILLLQQLENNLIYPKVMGRAMGLPGGIVLAAVLAGGALFGIPGMLLFVPAASFLWQKLQLILA